MKKINILKEHYEVTKGKRGGKYITTKSGRTLYIKDNGSAYQKINKENGSDTPISNND